MRPGQIFPERVELASQQPQRQAVKKVRLRGRLKWVGFIEVLLNILSMLKKSYLAFPLLVCSLGVQASEALVFDCQRWEKDYSEKYIMKIVPSSSASKAKVYLDDRDLDRKDEGGYQTVTSVQFSAPANILILMETRFEPELVDGITYSAGKVSTQITLNRTNGVLKKTDTIQGGILGANLGNGTHLSEELCMPKVGAAPSAH